MPAWIKRLAWKDIPWLYCIGAALFPFLANRETTRAGIHAQA